ncbi:MAG: tetratricopeptide repeat protein [Sphingorhabdus sp.]|uniref:tetratricopeptide repeat protein n=1 Tax=Sphingorhabdus sp. TaxID=1902408 RepID=UPI003C8F2B28
MALPPTDKRAATDEAFLREVDDAVRAGDLENFWKRYGRWLAIALIIGLAAFGGWIYWQNQQAAAAEKQGEQFILAVEKLQGGNVAAAKTDLGKLAKAEQPGYPAMAQILLANITAAEGNTKKAVLDYGKVAGDQSLPQVFRDLALIRQTTVEFDTLPPQQVIDRLKPLAKPGTAWFGSAGEMTAISYMKLGKDNLAGPIFAQIAKQEDLPQTLRARAQQMAGALGVDTVQLDAKPAGASAAADAGKDK